MTSSNGGIMRRIDPRSRERFEWTLFPLALIAYATGALALLALMAQAFTLPAAFGSTGAVLLDLHSTFELPATAGTHHYFGGAFIQGATRRFPASARWQGDAAERDRHPRPAPRR